MKKFSKYNTTLRISPQYGICYNAVSDKFVLQKSQAYDEMCGGNIENIKQHYPDLYEQLNAVRAIVDCGVDEVSQVHDVIRAKDNDDTVFHLHVNPTVDCNFHCWYCYENHVKGSKMQPEMVARVKALMENILSTHEHLESFVLSFFGGEPLMYFNVVARPLIEHLYALCREHEVRPFVSFTTNGYLLNRQILDFFGDKEVSFQITLDGDRQRHDKTRFMAPGKGSFDKIVANIKLLARHGHNVIMRINYTADNISSMNSIVDEFADMEEQCRSRITVDFQRVWQDIDKAADEDAVDTEVYNCIKMFHENGFKVSCAKTSNNVQNTCYGSMRNYALVNYNGDVYQCTARDFNKANCYGWLSDTGGLVYENGLKEKRETARFSKEVCHDCRIAPVCGGGCAQKAMELYDTTDCVFGYTEEGINDFVLDRFEYSLLLGEMNGDKCIICR